MDLIYEQKIQQEVDSMLKILSRRLSGEEVQSSINSINHVDEVQQVSGK